MKKFIALTLLLTLFSCATKKPIVEVDPVDFSFIAIGDVPYGQWQMELYHKKYLPMLEAGQGEFVIHVGDTKTGSSLCSNQKLDSILESFKNFKLPLFYTPGDNEWTDCHRLRTRGKKKLSAEQLKATYPNERLNYIRKTYYKDPSVSLGGANGIKIVAKSQGLISPEYPEMVENQLWSYKDLLFASVHIVGSNNNASEPEFKKRDQANVEWLKYAFAKAKLTDSKALVIYYHAEVEFNPNPKKQGGFKSFLSELTRQAPYYNGQILLIHGDSHKMTLDRPLQIPGDRFENPIANVMRLEVPGGYNQMGYVEIQVLKNKQDFFRFRPVLLPETEASIKK